MRRATSNDILLKYLFSSNIQRKHVSFIHAQHTRERDIFDCYCYPHTDTHVPQTEIKIEINLSKDTIYKEKENKKVFNFTLFIFSTFFSSLFLFVQSFLTHRHRSCIHIFYVVFFLCIFFRVFLYIGYEWNILVVSSLVVVKRIKVSMDKLWKGWTFSACVYYYMSVNDTINIVMRIK